MQTHAADTGARALVDAVQAWLAEPGADPSEIAVLTRVQSLLLAPHVVLADAGIPVDSILDESVLSRLGVRAALAYVRIAVDPDHVSGADLSEVHRRPSRGLPQWATKWLDRCRSVSDVRGRGRPHRRRRRWARSSTTSPSTSTGWPRWPRAAPPHATCSPPCATTSGSARR